MVGSEPSQNRNTMSKLLVMSTLLCVLAVSVGQLLFKKAAQAMPPHLELHTLLNNRWLWASLLLYAVTTLVS